MLLSPRRCCLALCFNLVFSGWLVTCEVRANDPPPPDGTAEATKAMAAFRVPAGFRVSLFAAEPALGAPVAICLDEQGRVYAAEEYRFNRGTEENRTRPFLLEDDLQIQSLDDRLKMYEKYVDRFEGGMEWFHRYADQVRRLEDKDGDGRAEISTIFAGDFNGTLDGLAAGVIARDGDVYLTCIPNLWRLRDRNNDGVAEQRESLATGFGINAGFLGHDLHGLAWGPDGKLYFSVGDRGFHIETKEGKTLHGPRTGGVFRCNPDGSELEVVARGMRNPQELAFDEYGNLFAVDNNCDKGDHSRLVYVLEGGDSGWNMAYQSIQPPYLTGPWHAEQIWHLPPAEHQPAWILPAVGKIGAGPSGFTYYPGVGLPAKYANHFFYCNYTGNGGVESFAVQPKGAGFEIIDHQDFLKPVSATDCDFGYDGKLYVSDFVQLHWNGGPAKGRMYTVENEETIKAPQVAEVRELFKTGFAKRTPEELLALIRQSADLRVRQRAQFELANRGIASLREAKSLVQDEKLLARLHGVWLAGQLVKHSPAATQTLLPLLEDADPEVRTQAARVLGENKVADAAQPLITKLMDDSPRVRLYAALALSRIGIKEVVAPAIEMLRANNDQDPFLRHGGVMALAESGALDEVLKYAQDTSVAVRLGVLLVMRKQQDSRIALFLNDAEPRLVTEAARAINDLPLDAATPALAALLERCDGASPAPPEALLRRVLNANFRLGGKEQAGALAKYAAQTVNPPKMRGEAIAALADWANPSQRDRVNGFWRPLEKRSAEIPKGAVSQQLSALLASADGELSAAVVKLVEGLGISAGDDVFIAWVTDAARPDATRIAALRLLAARKSAEVPKLLESALSGSSPLLRATARELLVQLDPARGRKLLIAAAEQGELAERQLAFTTLGEQSDEETGAVVLAWLEKLSRGEVKPEVRLDVIEAARVRKQQAIQDRLTAYEATLSGDAKLARFQPALEGGNAERGRQLFVSHAVAQCVRCHKTGGSGGDAGPDLSKVATRGPREYLLQSILEPNAKIAQGFATVTLQMTDGRVVAGTLKSEENGKLTVLTPKGETFVISADEVEDRSQPTSAMPDVLKALTPREVRDLVAYLSTLK